MTIKKHGIFVETPTEARQAEPGPSVLALLTISTSYGQKIKSIRKSGNYLIPA
jgi:hypothetical protein